MDINDELAWRRKAIRLTLKGLRPQQILQQIPRGRTWLFNWQTRFAQGGWEGLNNKSRRPTHRRRHMIVTRVRSSSQQFSGRIDVSL